MAKGFESTGDIVSDIVRYLRANCPGIPDEQLQSLEREVRRAYEGDRPYVLGEATTRKRAATRQIVRDVPVGEQAAALGLGRATIYRHLKKAFPTDD